MSGSKSPIICKRKMCGNSGSVLLVFAFFGIVVGGIILLVIGVEKKLVHEARTWPVVPGTIISAEVRSQKSKDSKGYRTYTYYPEAIYEFSYNGQRYTSNVFRTVGVGTMVSDRYEQERKLMRWPVGAAVAVSCDPKDPGRSVVLEVHSSKGVFWNLFYAWSWIGWAFVGAGGLFLKNRKIYSRLEMFMVSGLLLLLASPAVVIGFPDPIALLIGGFFGLIGLLGVIGNIYEIVLLLRGRPVKS